MNDDQRLNKISEHLDVAMEFITDELEQRRTSGLPKSDPYVKRAVDALKSIERVRQLL